MCKEGELEVRDVREAVPHYSAIRVGVSGCSTALASS